MASAAADVYSRELQQTLYDALRVVLARRARIANDSDSMVLYNVACVYSLGKMTDEALDCLDKAIQNGFGHREWLDNDSDLDALRDDPRFQALRQKL